MMSAGCEVLFKRIYTLLASTTSKPISTVYVHPIIRFRSQLTNYQGAAEARYVSEYPTTTTAASNTSHSRAHNPEDLGSKPSSAMQSLFAIFVAVMKCVRNASEVKCQDESDCVWGPVVETVESKLPLPRSRLYHYLRIFVLSLVRPVSEEGEMWRVPK
jgi:hypothetical protein